MSLGEEGALQSPWRRTASVVGGEGNGGPSSSSSSWAGDLLASNLSLELACCSGSVESSRETSSGRRKTGLYR